MNVLTVGEWELLRAVATRVAPGLATVGPEEQQRFFEIVEEALGERPPALQRQLRVFLQVVRWLPAARYGGPLERLCPGHQDRALAWFQDCPIAIVRKGFWGLKALVYMGYYSLPGTAAKIGYAPCFDGNARLHGQP